MHYRKIYCKSTGSDIPDKYQVHHIDHNRSNNNIENLVAIPKKLHNKYHRLTHKYNQSIEIINRQFGFASTKQQSECIKSIIDYMQVKDEILSFMFIRNELLSK